MRKTVQPDAALCPWQLEPKLASAIWGAGELVREYGKHGDPHAKIGESWECWNADAVTNGPPDDAYAQRVEHQLVGKTECWYVMAARPGAELVVGWTRDTSRAEYEQRVERYYPD
jgi:mannose-6-phosphate isomerase class I